MSDLCQRWNRGRDSYRPAGEPIDPSRYGVEVITKANAKAFVNLHHYSHSFPAARCSVGLFRGRDLVGTAVFSVPMNNATIPRYVGGGVDGVELGRLVMLDDVPANGETWFLSRAFKALKQEKPDVGAVVSYSDPIERTSADGLVVKPGHVGVIYQAFNARYVGVARAETLILDTAGCVISRRALSKIRNDEKGAAYAYEQLIAAGAPPRRPLEDGIAYVTRALAEGPFRRMKHPGNHAYCWSLRKGVDLKLPAQPFPKQHAAPSPLEVPCVC